MIKHGLILLLIFLDFLRLSAQSPLASCDKSTEGTDFWFGFMENRNYQVPQYPFYLPIVHYTEITLISIHPCNVKIYIGQSLTPSFTRTLNPNIPTQIRIPWQDVEAIGSESVQGKAIHLVSDNPLNLYALNWCENSADVAVIFPKKSIGNEYYTMCYTPNVQSYFDSNGNETYGNGRNSEFLIVATEDNTKVIIIPSKNTDKLHFANIPFTINLNKGELYQVQSLNHSNLTGQGDLTGSYIKSDRPISVFSGNLATSVPAEVNVDAWDHLYEQMPPLPSWGRKFVTVPLKGRSKDVFRVLASHNNTTVRIGGKKTVVLNKGEYDDSVLSENEPTLIDSDYPVLLAQYMVSNSVDRPPGRTMYDWDGDPFMVIVSPVEQTREAVTFVAYDSQNINNKYYVNIVTKDNATKQILLDGEDIPFQTLTNSGYSFAQVKIEKGKHDLNSTESGKGFIAYVYGYGSVESYGYGVGFNLNIQLDLGGDIHFVKDTLLLCQGQVRILDAGSHFSKFLWSTGDTTQTIFVTKAGYSKVTATTSGGCTLSDSIYTYLSNPVVNLGEDNLCQAQSFLDAGAGFSSYLWSTKETTRKISVNTAGSYSVSAWDKYGCPAKDTIQIGFGQIPKLYLDKLDTLICGSQTTSLNIAADKGSYLLKSSDPRVSVKDLTVTVPQFGTYPFIYSAVDQNNCKADTNFTIGFQKVPSVHLNINDTTCYNYALEAKYLGDAEISRTKFTWIFANDILANGIGMDKIQLQIGKDQINRNLYLSAEEKGCINSTSIQEIKVIPDVDFTVPDTLICEQKEVVFSVSNSENVVDYHWNWGDGTLEHLGEEAMHLYQKNGLYTIQLTVTTDKKCSNSIEKKNFLYVEPIPTIGFSIDPEACLNPGPNSLSYIGSATVNDKFYWDLSRLDPVEVIHSPENTSGPLIFDLINKPSSGISLQVVSKNGCKSESKSLNFKRKPVFSFGSDAKVGCTPLQIKFKATPGDPVDMIGYHWNFGDGRSISGQEVSPTFSQPDRYYDLAIKAVSSTTGCSDSLLAKDYILTYPNPKAGFSMNPEIAYNDASLVSFSDQSKDAVRYLWDFGDGKRSNLGSPSHKYELVGARKVLQTVYSQFNCSDTTSKYLMVVLRKIFAPNAFSPSAFSLIDREFKLSSNGVLEEGYHLKILSRWNDIVFECKNEIKGWDGKLSNGSMAQPGNYIWILEFTDFQGNAHRQMGTVMLIY